MRRVPDRAAATDRGSQGAALAPVFADDWCGVHIKPDSGDKPDVLPFEMVGAVPPDLLSLPQTYRDDKEHVPPGQACGGRPWPAVSPDRADRDEPAVLPFPGVLKGFTPSKNYDGPTLPLRPADTVAPSLFARLLAKLRALKGRS